MEKATKTLEENGTPINEQLPDDKSVESADKEKPAPKVIEFFLPIKPPTTTYQMHRIKFQSGNGKPIIYDSDKLKEARAKLKTYLAPHRPDYPMDGALRLITKWCFPILGSHRKNADGIYKITKPDTDNLQKLLKDLMTELKFFFDDAQIASEVTEKFYAKQVGIYIHLEVIDDSQSVGKWAIRERTGQNNKRGRLQKKPRKAEKMVRDNVRKIIEDALNGTVELVSEDDDDEDTNPINEQLTNAQNNENKGVC